MALYSPLRDAFKDLNRFLIDKQEWNAKHELNRNQQEMQSRLLDAQLADNQLNRQLTKFKVAELEEEHKPMPFTIFPFIDNDIETMKNPEFRSTMKSILAPDEADAKWNQGMGTLENAEGVPYKFSKFQLKRAIPFIKAMQEKNMNRPAIWHQRKLDTYKQLLDVDKRISDVKKISGGRAVQRVTELASQKSALQTRATELEEQLSPDGLLAYYDNQYQLMKEAQAASIGYGLDKLAASYGAGAEQAAINSRNALAKATAGTTGKKGYSRVSLFSTESGEYVGSAGFNPNDNTYNIGGEVRAQLPQGVTPVAPKQQKRWPAIYDRIAANYGTKTAEGQWMITAGLEGKHRVAQAKKTQLLKDRPKMSDDMVIEESIAFVDGIEQELITFINRALTDPTFKGKKNKAVQERIIIQNLEDFQKNFNYIPTEARKALEGTKYSQLIGD